MHKKNQEHSWNHPWELYAPVLKIEEMIKGFVLVWFKAKTLNTHGQSLAKVGFTLDMDLEIYHDVIKSWIKFCVSTKKDKKKKNLLGYTCAERVFYNR